MDKFLNKLVRITLTTGVGVEGIPCVWNEQEVIISYPDNPNYTVIFNPLDNVMMVSVFGEHNELDSEQAVQFVNEYDEVTSFENIGSDFYPNESIHDKLSRFLANRSKEGI